MFARFNNLQFRVAYNIVSFLIYKFLFIKRNYILYSMLSGNAASTIFMILNSNAEMCRSFISEGVADVVLIKNLVLKLKNKKELFQEFREFLGFCAVLFLFFLPVSLILIRAVTVSQKFLHIGVFDNIMPHLFLFFAQFFLFLHVIYDCLLACRQITFFRSLVNIMSVSTSLFFLLMFKGDKTDLLIKSCFVIFTAGFFNFLIMFMIVSFMMSELVLPSFGAVRVVFKSNIFRLLPLGFLSLLKRLYCGTSFEIFSIMSPEAKYYILKYGDIVSCGVISTILVPLQLVVLPFLTKFVKRPIQLKEHIQNIVIGILFIGVISSNILLEIKKQIIINVFLDIKGLTLMEFVELAHNLINYIRFMNLEILNSFFSLFMIIGGNFRGVIFVNLFAFALQFLYYFLLHQSSLNVNLIASVAKCLAATTSFLMLCYINRRTFLEEVFYRKALVLSTTCICGQVVFTTLNRVGFSLLASVPAYLTVCFFGFHIFSHLFQKRETHMIAG